MNKIIDFVIDSVNAGRERLKMSIVTFYIALLVLYHWRVFAVLFFGGFSMIAKIEFIDSLYEHWTLFDFIMNSILLLLLSITCSLLFPFIMWKIDYFLLSPTQNRKQIKNRGSRIDRQEEIDKAQHDYELLQISSGHKSTQQFILETKRLKEENDGLKSDIIHIKDDYENTLKKERNLAKHYAEEMNHRLRHAEDENKMHILNLKKRISTILNNIRLQTLSFKYNNSFEAKTIDTLNNIVLELNEDEREIIHLLLSNYYDGIKNEVSINMNESSVQLKTFVDILQKLKMIDSKHMGENLFLLHYTDNILKII